MRRTFEVGLVLSGTVSSGAYTAGVIDFLIEALREWQTQKDSNPASVPDHDVVIKVVAGNSGGAFTSLLIPGAILGDFVSYKGNAGQNIVGASNYLDPVENRLYQSWVRDVDIRNLLDGSDLSNNSLDSLLNSNRVDAIADDFTKVIPHGKPVPWIAPELHFYLMLTNLNGIPYNIDLNTGAHYMRQHGDYQHFVLSGQPPNIASVQLSNDSPVWLNPKMMYQQKDGWKTFRNAALASGAFPVALRAQTLSRLRADYEHRSFSTPIEARRAADNPAGGYYVRQTISYRLSSICPSWDVGVQDPMCFTAVDGGVVNNDPLEFARLALTGSFDKSMKRSGDGADQAVIMVSPLNGPPVSPTSSNASMLDIVKSLLPCFLDQTRFKLTELQLAQDLNVYSRYLISPKDYAGGGKYFKYPIYCSLLSAFGGFFLESLREHDYLLGRRNCQQFLLEHFDLPSSNAIVAPYTNNSAMNIHRSNNGQAKEFTDKDSIQRSEIHYRIIPLCGSAAVTCTAPARIPNIPDAILAEKPDVKTLLRRRVDRVSDILISQAKASQKGFLWFALATVLTYSKPIIFLLKRRIVDWLIDQINDCYRGMATIRERMGHLPPDKLAKWGSNLP